MTAASIKAEEPPDRFYMRFNEGRLINCNWPRITDEESEKLFLERDDGLKVLLINAPIREWSFPNIMPIGQGYIASVLKMDGHKIHVLDLNAARGGPIDKTKEALRGWICGQVETTLTDVKPDIIGIGGIVTQYSSIKFIVECIRSFLPDKKIVLGGGVGSCMPKFMVERMGVDIVVKEEGEVTISEVCHMLELGQPLDNVKGIAYRKKVSNGDFEIEENEARPSLLTGQEGLDGLPWPLRSAWPLEEVYKRNPVGHLNWKTKWDTGKSKAEAGSSLSVVSSRGCPYTCDYCYAQYLGNAYRLRGIEDLVDEMEYLVNRFGVEYIHFLDDLSLTDYKWSLEFFDLLKRRQEERGFSVLWGASLRTNIVSADIDRAICQGRKNILELGYEVGLRQVVYGIETGSETILENIDKSGQSPERIKKAVKETIRVLGYADCSFMVGSPGETEDTINETVALCKDIGLEPEVFFFTTAYPATPFWNLALEKGLISKSVTGKIGNADEDMIERYLLLLGEQGDAVRTNFSDLSDDEIVKLSWKAVQELSPQNKHRHPGSGDVDKRSIGVLDPAHANV